MTSLFSPTRLRSALSRLKERLWVKPLALCILSVAIALAAKFADDIGLPDWVPNIKSESVETLLKVMASSMLVIATFAVASMVSAYASASGAATPRSFPLVLADDVSQNALSTFIGAFIFSIVALIAVSNSYYGSAGRFTLFTTTIFVFVAVIATFVRWVDRIARLGRLGSIADKVEDATQGAIDRYRRSPTLGGVPVTGTTRWNRSVASPTIGYVQQVDMQALQAWAQRNGGRIRVDILPGGFAGPGRALAQVSGIDAGTDVDDVAACFEIGRARRFDNDPRFGLIVLAEIADRALSPGVNDPGTAIGIIASLVRLLARLADPRPEDDGVDVESIVCDRVEVPAITVRDLFDDAFRPIARDGAGTVEVAVRLQKALASLHAVGDAAMRDAALHHQRQALERSREAMTLTDDIEEVARAAGPAAAAPQAT